MAHASGQNFHVHQDNDKILEYTIYDDNDVILDITNSTFTWVAYKRNPENVVITKSVGGGITLTNPTNGVLRVTLDADDVKTLLGSYNHELKLVDQSGFESTVATGYMQVDKSKIIT